MKKKLLFPIRDIITSWVMIYSTYFIDIFCSFIIQFIMYI